MKELFSKKYSRYLFFGGIFVILSTLVGFAGLEKYVTAKPGFCLTCHINQSYSKFSEPSKVHPKIDCAECHANHTELVPRDFSAGDARVNDNCQRCHGNILREDSSTFKSNVKKIIIPHERHVTEIETPCTTCHANIYHDKQSPITNRPRMEFCYNCHSPDEKCATCHPKGTVELPLSKTIHRSECVKCHPGYQDKKITIFNVQFFHKRHFHRVASCDLCHSNAEKHGAINLDRENCLNCHHKTVREVFNVECKACHQDQLAFMNGSAYPFMVGSPDPMASEVSCEDCHKGIAEKHNIEKVKQSCVDCHDKEYAGKVDQIRAGISEELAQILSRIDKARISIQSLDPIKKEKFNQLLEESAEISRIVLTDKSSGIHNSNYAYKLLEKASEILDRMDKKGLN
ncbi:MAG: cytochrome c3 family protein [Deltaproteobacteria bacterium]|nr:cytochrome c3 family protein [Deltaproteobacteria bacterium]